MDDLTFPMPGPSTTRILTRADIARLMQPSDYLEAVQSAFAESAAGRAVAPAPMHIQCGAGGFHVKGAALSDKDVAAFKVNGNFPDNPVRGLPTIRGVIALCDSRDGALVALMDSIEITLRRTAAATALAATRLARPDSTTVMVVGCGDQAGPQLEALLDVLPLKSGWLFDVQPARAEALQRRLMRKLSLATVSAEGFDEAVRGADIIVTCTPSTRPILHPGQVSPGTFIAAVGADAPHKNEIASSLMAMTTVVADVVEQAASMGDLHHALEANAVRLADVRGLADLVSGRRTGRTSQEEITLFDSTGTALQDVAAAAVVARRAQMAGVGTMIDLGGGDPGRS